MPLETLGEPAEIELGRRYLTLLFADLSQSTELSELMETEHYAAVLAAVRRVYQETIPRHGGMVVRTQGDGLLALFGYPVTREHDGRSAVAAALEIHEKVRKLQLQLPAGRSLALHTGIHSGLVLLRSGNMELGRLELLGPVPNVAARLSDAAAAHEILVSEDTLGPASRFFVTRPPRLLKVKGRADPLLVYAVDASTSPAQSFDALGRDGAKSFLGREAELELLGQALDEAIAGRTRSISVAGAPGMGKTRLIEHFLGRALQRGGWVLRGYCESELRAEPLQPFRHMVQALALDTPPTNPESFAVLFGRLAEQQPLVLFVDDWQWADDASHQVLAALRKCTQCRLLIVVSTRSEALQERPPATDQTLQLSPLSQVEAKQLIAARLPGADPFIADLICDSANGNPLFLEELCHSAARGSSELQSGRLQGGASWLKRLVESRVQHLPPAQLEMVRVAAVIGTVIPAWLLEEMTGQPADSPLQLSLAEQDFIFPGEQAGTLRFKHAITRDIIYESVGLHARQQLHLRIARALQQHSANESQAEALEALAHHFDAADDPVHAAEYAEKAGDRALAAAALDRARSLYRVALAALDRMLQTPGVALRWVAIVQRLGRVGVFDPLRSELALFARAVELAERFGDRATVARARHWLGYINYGLGNAHAAIENGEHALVDARASGDQKLVDQVTAALGQAYCATAQYDHALGLLDHAIAVERLGRRGRHINVGLSYSLICRGYLVGDRGLFSEAHKSFDEASSCIGGATHGIGATLNGWRSAVLLWQGRWEEARDAANESARIAEATRSLAQLSVARAISAYAEWMLSGQPECLEVIAEATQWLTPRGSGLFRSLNHGWLAEGYAREGRRRESRRHAAQALQRKREGDLLGAAMTYRALAQQATIDRPHRASHYLRLAMNAACARQSAHEIAVTQLAGAKMAWESGRSAEALPLLEQAIGALSNMQMKWHLEEALNLKALIEQPVLEGTEQGSATQEIRSAAACPP